MHGDDIAMFDTEIVSHNTVDTNTPVIKIIICQNDQDRILPLLALDQDCVATEELEGFHSVVGKSDNRVVVVNGIRHAI